MLQAQKEKERVREENERIKAEREAQRREMEINREQDVLRRDLDRIGKLTTVDRLRTEQKKEQATYVNAIMLTNARLLP